MTNDVNDIYFKILCEWKAVSEQTLHGKQNVSNKKLKPRIWGMLLPATVKLIGIRCTLSYRITEREAQDSNPWKKKITRWTPLQFTDTQATGQQRKNQTWTQWSLWAVNLVKKRQLKIRERVSERGVAERELWGLAEFFHVFSWVLMNGCIWGYHLMLGKESPEKNRQTILGTQMGGMVPKWALVEYSEGYFSQQWVKSSINLKVCSCLNRKSQKNQNYLLGFLGT